MVKKSTAKKVTAKKQDENISDKTSSDEEVVLSKVNFLKSFFEEYVYKQ